MKILCIKHINSPDLRTPKAYWPVKNEIYTATGEVKREDLKGDVGYRIAEFPPKYIYAKHLFIELPDLSDKALEKEKNETVINPEYADFV